MLASYFITAATALLFLAPSTLAVPVAVPDVPAVASPPVDITSIFVASKAKADAVFSVMQTNVAPGIDNNTVLADLQELQSILNSTLADIQAITAIVNTDIQIVGSVIQLVQAVGGFVTTVLNAIKLVLTLGNTIGADVQAIIGELAPIIDGILTLVGSIVSGVLPGVGTFLAPLAKLVATLGIKSLLPFLPIRI